MKYYPLTTPGEQETLYIDKNNNIYFLQAIPLKKRKEIEQKNNLKLQLNMYLLALQKSKTNKKILLECYEYILDLLRTKEKFVFSTNLLILQVLTLLLEKLKELEIEKFYLLAECFFENTSLLDYDSNIPYPNLDQASLGLSRSLYLNLSHQQQIEELKKEKNCKKI